MTPSDLSTLHGCIRLGRRNKCSVGAVFFVRHYVQTINKFTSALLHGQDILQAKHWNWALFHAIDCRNRVPNVKTRPQSPYEMVTGIKTNLHKTFQFVFGDMVAVHLPKERRNWKFDMRWDVGIYVG